MSILVLEDDDALRESIVEFLEDENLPVQAAASAAEALRLAESEQFELIITDVRMAGMDGLDCLLQLKRRWPGLQSIVMTGYADATAPPRALEVGASDYLYKPFSLQELRESVSRVLERPARRSLLHTLVAGAQKLLQRDPATQAAREMGQVEEQRDALFRTFFVAVRSRALGEQLAWGFWVMLEELDETLDRVRDPEQPSERRKQLLDELTAVRRLIQVCARHDQVISADAFRGLFTRILESSVSTEELILAPFVRKVDSRVRGQSPELDKLYQRVWAP